jgi:hypothetical protein
MNAKPLIKLPRRETGRCGRAARYRFAAERVAALFALGF